MRCPQTPPAPVGLSPGPPNSILTATTSSSAQELSWKAFKRLGSPLRSLELGGKDGQHHAGRRGRVRAAGSSAAIAQLWLLQQQVQHLLESSSTCKASQLQPGHGSRPVKGESLPWDTKGTTSAPSSQHGSCRSSVLLADRQTDRPQPQGRTLQTMQHISHLGAGEALCD